MALRRLTIALHCWPARRPPRRGPGASDGRSSESLPSRRFRLADVELEGDDARDLERFDSLAAGAMSDCADRLPPLGRDRFAALHSLGYATRIELSATGDVGGFELNFPPELLAACAALRLSIRLTSEPIEVESLDEFERFAMQSQ